MPLTRWSHAWSKSGNISSRWILSDQAVLGFEHTQDILNTYFSYVWYLYRRTFWQSLCLCGTLCFGGDLTKPAITIASDDRFYSNLVICLQLDMALLIQNSLKNWRCLPELWQCLQGVTFSRTQCIYYVCYLCALCG